LFLHGSKARHSAFHREDSRHGRLFPAMNEFLRRRCGCGADIAKRPAGKRKRRRTVLPRKTGRHNRDDRLVGPFSTEVT
jgi:hypothetical protein